ncbi:MAG: hypothetical protein MJZ75_03220 [Paludibacteraceae bacterium]|nr:hypothetical protein [Paludibacteraceae bacterium]
MFGAEKTYNCNTSDSLNIDWTIRIAAKDSATLTIADKSNNITAPNGNMLAMSFPKSNSYVEITSTATYQKITNISFDVSSSDNGKPQFTISIVDSEGNETILLQNATLKGNFGNPGTNKWGKASIDVASVTGSIRIYLSTGSSGKYAGIDNITVTYTAADCPPNLTGDTTAYFFKGQSVTVWGETFSAETTRQKTYKTADGCDSIVTLHVKETTSGSITNASICEGKTYTWAANGKTYSQTTSASVVKKNKQGTDSICMLYLTVTPTIRTRETYNLAVGESYTWNGQTYTKAGDYTYTTSSRVTGCDSIVTLHLTQDTPTNITATICKGDTFYWYINGTLYTKKYSSTSTSTTQGGIKYYLNLTVQEATYQEYTYRLNLVQHEQYTWNGKVYSSPGIYFDTTEVYEDSGCPKKIEYLILNGDTAASTCDGVAFYWDRTGESTTSNTTKTYKFPTIKINGSGKYASISNKITKGNKSSSNTNATILVGQSYPWFGKQYTRQGIYHDTIPNAAGCDSIGTLTLGVCKSTPDTGYIKVTINKGDSLYWKYRNTHYYTTTHDEVQFQNIWGCDSVLILDLTVQGIPDGKYKADVMCEGDTYMWRGKTYTQPGTYHDGDSILVLGMLPNPNIEVCEDKVVNHGESTQLTVTGADYYAWDPIDYLSSEWSDRPTCTPDVTIAYQVKSYNSAAASAVTNGDFESGNIGFTTDGFVSTAGGTYGKYIIAHNANEMGWDNIYDHTTGDGTGSFMVMDGFDQPDKIIWQQKVKVSPNTDYIFSAWFISLNTSFSKNSFTQFQFFVNGERLGDITESPHEKGVWGRYYELWDSGTNTEATLTIMDQNTDNHGNDFGIDDISFQALGPCFGLDSVKVTVNFNVHLYPSCTSTTIEKRTTSVPGMTNRTVTFEIPEYCTAQQGTYVEGDQITVYAHDEECRVFSHWSDGNTDNPRIFTVGKSNFKAQAIYVGEPFAIITDQEGEGTVTGGHDYTCNETATVTATPDECWRFVKWKEDGDTNPVRTFEVTEERTLTAIFEKIPYIITINTHDNTTTQGSVTGSITTP